MTVRYCGELTRDEIKIKNLIQRVILPTSQTFNFSAAQMTVVTDTWVSDCSMIKYNLHTRHLQ